MPAAKTKTTRRAATKSVKAAPQTSTAAPKAAAQKVTDSAAETVETATHSVFDFSEQARGQYDAFLKTMNENAEQFSGAAQEFVDATRTSFENAQAHAQEMSTEIVETARQDMSDAVDFANELARAKTVGDALEIQRDYWTRVFEARVERTRAATEKMAGLAREAVEPMTTAKSFPLPFTMPMATASGFDTDYFKSFFPFAAK